MKKANKKSIKNVLINLFRLAKEFGNSSKPIIWELGHYLIDNLISKICIFVAYDKNEESKLFKTSKKKWTKDFPNLYKDLIVFHYPSAPDYDSELESHHKRRNIFQHSETSIEFSFRKEYVETYVDVAEKILNVTGIIDQNTDVSPTTFLKKGGKIEASATVIKKKEIPTGLDPNDKRIDILKKILRNLSIRYYSEGYHQGFSRMMSRIIEELSKFNSIYFDQFLDTSHTVAHQKIIRYFFNETIQGFKKKLQSKKIIIEKIQRPLLVLAGDLALEFWEEHNLPEWSKSNLVERIGQNYQAMLSQTTYFLQEEYQAERFKKALLILEEEYGLIKTTDPKYEGSDSTTEWEIIDLDGLHKFIKWKSIEDILKRIEV